MLMRGPRFDGSGKLTLRDVPEADVQAYRAAGYVPVPAETGAHEPAEEAAAAPPPAPATPPAPKRKTRKK